MRSGVRAVGYLVVAVLVGLVLVGLGQWEDGSVHSRDAPCNATTCGALLLQCRPSEHNTALSDDPYCTTLVPQLCSGDSDSLLDYTFEYACVWNRSPALLVLMAFEMILLFILLGAAAEKFLCPALACISDTLHVPHDIAGITFLALGNGAPDVFGTFAAVKQHSYGISVGALLGAGLFVQTVVVAGVALVSDAKVQRGPFLRDTIFYVAGVLMFFLFLLDGSVAVYEAVLMLVFYIGYVVFASVMTMRARRRLRLLRAVDGRDGDETVSVTDLSDEEEPQGDDGNMLSANIVEDESRDSISMQDLRRDHWKETQGMPDDEQSADLLLSEDQSAQGEQDANGDAASIEEIELFDDSMDALHSTGGYRVRTLNLFVAKWQKKSALKRLQWLVFGFIRLPLSITCPYIRWTKWDRFWTAGTFLFSPTFLLFVCGGLEIRLGNVFPLWILSLLLSAGLATAVLFMTKEEAAPEGWRALVLALWSFLLSIVWIYLLAGELVGILRTFGYILHISDVILGATVLAWGGSVGDFVSNLQMARAGYPEMSMAAAYGGPLFNLLLGSSVSLLFMTIREYPMEYATPLRVDSLVTAVFLLLNVVVTIAAVHFWGKYRVPRLFAIYLLGMYGIYDLFLILFGINVLPNSLING